MCFIPGDRRGKREPATADGMKRTLGLKRVICVEVGEGGFSHQFSVIVFRGAEAVIARVFGIGGGEEA